MTKYHKLLNKADSLGIDVIEGILPDSIRGLYCENDKGTFIGLNSNIETDCEKTCVFAEELGHHFTSHGNLLTDASVGQNIVNKQETIAKRWAYLEVVPFSELIEAEKAGCRNIYELADFLSVTESFLRDALNSFKEQYGVYKEHNGYRIYFDPFWVIKEEDLIEDQCTFEW